MKGLRARITPARWRKIHFRILGIGVCLILLNLGMGGSFLDGIPILAAMVLVILDFIGDILFFRCPACGRHISDRVPLSITHCPFCGAALEDKNTAHK